jgi:hypothetical protein
LTGNPNQSWVSCTPTSIVAAARIDSLIASVPF